MKRLEKIQIDKIKLRIALIALTGIVALGGLTYFIIGLFNKKSKTDDIKDIITTEAENTYFDDLLLEDLEKKLIDLEKYINISNKLNKLIEKKYTIEDESLKEEKLSTPEEIKELINTYETNKKDVDILRKLKIQSSLINQYLKTDGYDILADAMLYAFKIELVDAYGFDKKISKEILNDIIIPSYNEMNFGNVENRENSIKIGNNSIDLSVKFQNILSQIYNLQDNATQENIRGYNYHKDRNKLLEKSFDTLKDMIEEESKFNKMKIK